eukprot:TRINITY_DN1292_c0_g1_i1.p1 TRINITY_DN1292_c0_g1~~TRINITY_DN1292_c0_g1_i1.p1  ORF type:complete len:260 (+),score=27.52 TRINITY_DN1292_c0_g1_i1:7-786(+)
MYTWRCHSTAKASRLNLRGTTGVRGWNPLLQSKPSGVPSKLNKMETFASASPSPAHSLLSVVRISPHIHAHSKAFQVPHFQIKSGNIKSPFKLSASKNFAYSTGHGTLLLRGRQLLPRAFKEEVNSTNTGNEKKKPEEGNDAEGLWITKLPLPQKLTLAYGALIGGLGVMGYLYGWPILSLTSFIFIIAVLTQVYNDIVYASTFPSVYGLGVTLTLLKTMGYQFRQSGELFPTGLLALASLIMTGYYLYYFFSGTGSYY